MFAENKETTQMREPYKSNSAESNEHKRFITLQTTALDF